MSLVRKLYGRHVLGKTFLKAKSLGFKPFRPFLLFFTARRLGMFRVSVRSPRCHNFWRFAEISGRLCISMNSQKIAPKNSSLNRRLRKFRILLQKACLFSAQNLKTSELDFKKDTFNKLDIRELIVISQGI